MEYTAPTPISRGLAVLSPLHALIASANGNVLQIHHLPTNTLLHQLTTAAPITHIVWSSSSPSTPTHTPPSSPITTPLPTHPFVAVASRGGNVVVATSRATPVADIHDGRLSISWLSLCSPTRLLVGYEHSFGVALYNIDSISPSLITFFAYAMRPPPLPPISTATRVLSPCAHYVALVVRDRRRETNPDALLIVALSDGRPCARLPAPAGIRDIEGLRWTVDETHPAVIVWGATHSHVGVGVGERHKAATISVMGNVIGDDICKRYAYVKSEDEMRQMGIEGHHDENDNQHDGNINDLAHGSSTPSSSSSSSSSPSPASPSLSTYSGNSRITTIAVASISSSSSSKHFPTSQFNFDSFSPAPPTAKKKGLGIAVLARHDGVLHLVDVARAVCSTSFSHRRPEVDMENAPLVFRELRHDATRTEFTIIDWAPSLDIGRAPRAISAVVGDRDMGFITWMEISPCGTLLASRDASVPHVVFIWDLKALRLATMLVMTENVVTAKWSNLKDCDHDNGGPILAFACAQPWVYLWQNKGAAAVSVATLQQEGENEDMVEDGEHEHEQVQVQEEELNEDRKSKRGRQRQGNVGGGRERRKKKELAEFAVRRVRWASDDSALLLVDGVSARAFVTMYRK